MTDPIAEAKQQIDSIKQTYSIKEEVTEEEIKGIIMIQNLVIVAISVK